MNIRAKVKLSFVVILAMLLFLGFISAIITYQIKENSNFRESMAAILLMQEGMNDIIRESTQSTEISKLEQLQAKFVIFEKNFEALRETLSVHKKSLFASTIMLNLREDKVIQNYLNELYANEHRIELMYDEIFKLAREKLDYITVFNALYPAENRARIEIQEHILQHNRIEQIKALSDLRYYSKETLYQHGNVATLQKWLLPIDQLIDLTQHEKSDVQENLRHYREVVSIIADKAIKIEQTKEIENRTILEASKVLENNKKVSVSLEETISKLSSGFIDQMRFIQLFVGIVTILFIVFLSLKVSRNVSLTMDEVEAKIEEGLKEVNALNREIEDTQRCYW